MSETQSPPMPIIVLSPVIPLTPRPSTSSSSSRSTTTSSSSSPSGTPTMIATHTRTTTACPTPRGADYAETHNLNRIFTASAKTLPLPPPVLQPLRKHDFIVSLGAGSRRPGRRRVDPPKVWLGWLIVLPGVLVALLSAGLATTLLLYLAVRRGKEIEDQIPGRTRGFFVDEVSIRGDGGEDLLVQAQLWGLFGTTVITNIIWVISFPILMSLSAYCIASSWLSYQQRPRSLRADLLTPLQYALLFRLFTSPGPSAVAQASGYLASRHGRVPAPAFFARGVVLAGTVLMLSYLISIANMWLHGTARVVLLTPPHPSSTPIMRGYYPFAPTVSYLLLLYLHALFAVLVTIRVACLRAPRIMFAERTPEAEPVPNPNAKDVEAGMPVDRDIQELDNSSSTSVSVYSYPTKPKHPSSLALAHTQLTSPFAPIAALLAAPARLAGSGFSRAEGLVRALWVEDINTARVEVGVWRRDKDAGGAAKRSTGKRRRWGDLEADTDKDGVFGVYKKVVAWRGEIY
ncbi:hypothetical protein C8F01DRAFT_144838 [Mycena amicta]|nr:hypothetical protein C8F01DRAFT_144838 [Mycena amicta]